jgi:ParB family chromosome partitioning protein
MNDLFDVPAIVREAEELAALAAEINADHDAGESAYGLGLQHFRAAGEKLLRAKSACGHGRWLPWLKEHCPKIPERTAQRYMRLAKSATVADLPEAWMDACNRNDPGGEAGLPHVARATGREEWYTPAKHIEAARRVLGGIDLDPASSDKAQETVRATTYYTKQDDGLSKPWAGKVWPNPPYTSGLVEQFAEKLVTHYEAGDVTAAVVLVNNATETRWLGQLALRAGALCLPEGRVKFLKEGGEKGSPLQGQVVLYLGEDVDAFRAAFEQLGTIWRPFHTLTLTD